MLSFNDKTQMITLCGQSMTLHYFQAVQAPLLIDALHWSPSMIVSAMEQNDAPLGQLARLPRVQTFLMERDEQRQREAKERAERERLAFYNSPEQVEARRVQAEALHKSRLEQAARIRGARPASQSGGYGPAGGIVAAGEWDA